MADYTFDVTGSNSLVPIDLSGAGLSGNAFTFVVNDSDADLPSARISGLSVGIPEPTAALSFSIGLALYGLAIGRRRGAPTR